MLTGVSGNAATEYGANFFIILKNPEERIA